MPDASAALEAASKAAGEAAAARTHPLPQVPRPKEPEASEIKSGQPSASHPNHSDLRRSRAHAFPRAHISRGWRPACRAPGAAPRAAGGTAATPPMAEARAGRKAGGSNPRGACHTAKTKRHIESATSGRGSAGTSTRTSAVTLTSTTTWPTLEDDPRAAALTVLRRPGEGPSEPEV